MAITMTSAMTSTALSDLRQTRPQDFITLRCGDAHCVVSLWGGQVLSWQCQQTEQLYLSETAVFQASQDPAAAPPGLGIRGGIPVCFPQFSGLGPLPKHGWVRTRLWQLLSQQDSAQQTNAVLTFQHQPSALFAHAFTLELAVALRERSLKVSLQARNTGDTAFSFTGALHSYFKVSAIETVSLTGLEAHGFIDAVHANQREAAAHAPLAIACEVDRIYPHTTAPVVLRDATQRRVVTQTGFPDVVVWNPWADRCAALHDMPDADYRNMLCIEAALANAPQTLLPGQTWTGSQCITVG
jgi:glucose-6-phosphate 1-epimerase